MADKDPFQFPWASLAVVATLVSSTVLAPRAFDLLRPAEKDRAQALVSAELEVEARLWEDPFVATRRHETERLQRCCVFRTNVTARFGSVTGEFGSVTGHSGDVTAGVLAAA